MASAENIGICQAAEPARHQRSKSSVIRSFIGHRKNNSEGTALQYPVILPTTSYAQVQNTGGSPFETHVDRGQRCLMGEPRPLGELQHNNQDQGSRSPKKSRDRSPIKEALSTISLRSLAGRDTEKVVRARDTSPVKPKKAKSSTNLAGLLLRPKTSKNVSNLVDEEARLAKDKENRTPPGSIASDNVPPPPVYAQFTSQPLPSPQSEFVNPFSNQPSYHEVGSVERNDIGGVPVKQRPKSFQPSYITRQDDMSVSTGSHDQRGRSRNVGVDQSRKRQTWFRGGAALWSSASGSAPETASRAQPSSPVEPFLDPKDIDKHLEALLDRRNIPENQRYKMRNLTDTIKMEFIRQDWAETQASKSDHSGTNRSDRSAETTSNTVASDQSSKKKKHRSLTLSKAVSKGLPSPGRKQKSEGTVGRHFRSKSTESVVSDRPSSAASSTNSGFFSKVKGQQGPVDFVSYLRKVRKPELVEVGKLHKLRILLRNETVVWTEEFIRNGGMEEIVSLLHRTMEVEWREEHEDALLHENLLCLKALCTTALALQYVHSIRETLFPALLHLIFDPEKKGPSEFTTRNIITSVLLTYIQCAAPQDRPSRAQTVLRYLRDPEAKEEERPVSFVLDMRRDRPYRVWCKEVVNVTKEVFWIFLHNLNVVPLPPSSDRSRAPSEALATADHSTAAEDQGAAEGGSSASRPDYMARHFPQQRAPVPAAPYVGGVEWEATNYLASHLDLVNAILACTGSTSEERNRLRAELRVSGWERCMGGSMRLCKEKFYGAVHEGLRTWVAAAAEDGWDVRDVRYGPPPESRGSSPVRKAGGAGANKKKEAPPKLEMPKLDLGLGGRPSADIQLGGQWLS